VIYVTKVTYFCTHGSRNAEQSCPLSCICNDRSDLQIVLHFRRNKIERYVSTENCDVYSDVTGLSCLLAHCDIYMEEIKSWPILCDGWPLCWSGQGRGRDWGNFNSALWNGGREEASAFSVSVSVSVPLCLSVPVTLCLVCACAFVSVCVSACVYSCMCLCLSVYLCVSACACISLSLCLFCLCLSVPVPVYRHNSRLNNKAVST
jgi:hypothetical protein